MIAPLPECEPTLSCLEVSSSPSSSFLSLHRVQLTLFFSFFAGVELVSSTLFAFDGIPRADHLSLASSSFQSGRSHMLLVSKQPGEPGGGVGVVTLEDVVEESESPFVRSLSSSLSRADNVVLSSLTQ